MHLAIPKQAEWPDPGKSWKIMENEKRTWKTWKNNCFFLQIMENHEKKLTFQPTLMTLSVAFLL